MKEKWSEQPNDEELIKEWAKWLHQIACKRFFRERDSRGRGQKGKLSGLGPGANAAILSSALVRAGTAVMVEHCDEVSLPTAAQQLVMQIAVVLNETAPRDKASPGAMMEGGKLVQ